MRKEWEDIEQSIDLALTCNIDIIVTGDFNVNMLRNTSNDKISNLKNQFTMLSNVCGVGNQLM
jgi:hypothetical protein